MKVIHLLRKPCSESTVAANVLRHGTGAINIEATRITATDGYQKMWDKPVRTNIGGGSYIMGTQVTTDLSAYRPSGRWPANLVLQHLPTCEQAACAHGCPVVALDAQSGFLHPATSRTDTVSKGMFAGGMAGTVYQDGGGGASRFFKQVGGKVGGEE